MPTIRWLKTLQQSGGQRLRSRDRCHWSSVWWLHSGDRSCGLWLHSSDLCWWFDGRRHYTKQTVAKDVAPQPVLNISGNRRHHFVDWCWWFSHRRYRSNGDRWKSSRWSHHSNCKFQLSCHRTSGTSGFGAKPSVLVVYLKNFICHTKYLKIFYFKTNRT